MLDEWRWMDGDGLMDNWIEKWVSRWLWLRKWRAIRNGIPVTALVTDPSTKAEALSKSRNRDTNPYMIDNRAIGLFCRCLGRTPAFASGTTCPIRNPKSRNQYAESFIKCEPFSLTNRFVFSAPSAREGLKFCFGDHKLFEASWRLNWKKYIRQTDDQTKTSWSNHMPCYTVGACWSHIPFRWDSKPLSWRVQRSPGQTLASTRYMRTCVIHCETVRMAVVEILQIKWYYNVGE